MRAAYLIGVAIGAAIGFLVGVELDAQYLRDSGMMHAVARVGDAAPFLRAGSVVATIGALIGAGAVYILRATRSAR